MAYNSKYSGSELESILDNTLPKNNTTEFTPTGDYQPSTKKYVDDSLKAGGAAYTSTTVAIMGDSAAKYACVVSVYRVGGSGADRSICYVNGTISGTLVFSQLVIVGFNAEILFFYNNELIKCSLNISSGLDIGTPVFNRVGYVFPAESDIVTQDEYTALGDATATNGVLYFIKE